MAEWLNPALLMTATLTSIVRDTFPTPNLPSVRHYVEAAVSAASHRFPTIALHCFVEPILSRPNGRSQEAISAAIVCSELLQHLAKTVLPHTPQSAVTATLRIIADIFQSLVPLLTAPVGLARCLAQTGVMEAAPHLMPARLWSAVCDEKTSLAALRRAMGSNGVEHGRGGDVESLPCAPAGIAPLLLLLRHIALARDVQTMIGRQSRHVARLSSLPMNTSSDPDSRECTPASAVSLEGLLLVGRVEPHGELIPMDVFSAIKAEFTAAADMMHTSDDDAYAATEEEVLGGDVVAALRSGLLPPTAIHDARLRVVGPSLAAAGQLRSTTAEGHDGISPSMATPFNFQRKLFSEVTSNEQAQPASHFPPMPNASVSTAPSAPAAVAVRAHTQVQLTSVLTAVSATGRRCQPFIVVASLVDRVPNLGGLARTAEIFALEALLLPDGRIAKDPGFRDVSVSAADHVDLGELKPNVAGIAAYLRGKKAQGYTIIGLEQTARSVRLGAAHTPPLPTHVVLVLGAEREGVPATLLPELDIVLEIPQLGRIRSLNVHVSAAMVVWEYTRQRLDAIERV